MQMFILGMVVGIIISWLMVRWLINHALDRIEKQIGQTSLDQLMNHMGQHTNQQRVADAEFDKMPVTVEQHNNIYMVYHTDTSQFLAQGQDYWEVMSRLENIYPDRLFEITGGDAQAIATFMTTSEQARPA